MSLLGNYRNSLYLPALSRHPRSRTPPRALLSHAENLEQSLPGPNGDALLPGERRSRYSLLPPGHTMTLMSLVKGTSHHFFHRGRAPKFILSLSAVSAAVLIFLVLMFR